MFPFVVINFINIFIAISDCCNFIDYSLKNLHKSKYRKS